MCGGARGWRGPRGAMEAEVLIVGAGPAGSALATLLARAGRDVLLVERARFPRDKPCGDCLNPGAVAELRRLGLATDVQRQLRPRELCGWYVEAPDGRSFRAAFSRAGVTGAERGWAIRRRDLDDELLAGACRAGARVQFGLRVFDVMRRGDRVRGIVAHEGAALREIGARLVVGADGVRSVVRRRLGLVARPPRLKKIALVGHLASGDGAGSFGELRLRDGRCCGYAPLERGANVTLVVPQAEAAGIAGDPRRYFLDALSSFPAVRERVGRAGLERRLLVTGPFDQPVRRPWSRGALLVGDAAGYYDPFTGQGIYQALRSARLAAGAIEAILRAPQRERRVLAAYGRRMRCEFMATRAVQRVIEAFVRRPRALSWIMRTVLSENTGAEGAGGPARRLIRVTGDLDHPLTLLDPRLWNYNLRENGTA